MKKINITQDKNHLQKTQQYWDHAASNFDDEPDHGLQDPIVYEAWRSLLKTWLPSTPSTVLDIGCGTGSLSVLLANLGYKVTGTDLSSAMINAAAAKAKAKATPNGLGIEFHVMDAAFPSLAPRQFDAIICRHLLWSLPEPEKVLQRWTELLKQNGTLILVEGYWEAGGGLHLGDVLKMLPSSLTGVKSENLSDRSDLWGKNVADERYAIVARFPPNAREGELASEPLRS